MGKRCTSFGFDSRRGFACDTWLTIGFVKTGKWNRNVRFCGCWVHYIKMRRGIEAKTSRTESVRFKTEITGL